MTTRLLSIYEDNLATLDGYAVSRGLPRLGSLPVDRLCNFVWWWITRNASEEAEVEKVRTSLWTPPVGWEQPIEVGPWSAEEETSAFAALKASLSK